MTGSAFMSVAASIALPAQDDYNPLEGVTPNINAFGTEISDLTVLILGGLWALVLAFAVGYFLIGVGKWAAARKSHHDEELTKGAAQMKTGALAFGTGVAAPLIVGAIVSVIN